MYRVTLRRGGAFIATAAMLGSLWVVTAAAPAAAQATCDGKAVTITDNDGVDGDPRVGYIVGTDGNDVIAGTDGADRIFGGRGNDTICGGKGNDLIKGGAKRDRLFGGSGDDVLKGGAGPDDLFGWRGNDVIRGQANNDLINGGPGFDNCLQGAGRGPVRLCERADLLVRVIPPATGTEGSAPFKVKVRNRGPQSSPYILFLDESNRQASCSPPWEGLLVDYPALGRGKTRTITVEPDCTINNVGAWVEVEAEVFPIALDPRLGNNQATARVDLE